MSQLSRTDTVSAALYIDASRSMQGFAAAPGEFFDLLQTVERGFSRGWKQSALRCFQFGNKSTPILGEPCYASATKQSFYNLRRQDNITRLDRVLSLVSSEPADVSLIITDLYQDQADVARLVQAVKVHIFDRNLTLAIIAKRAPFNGTIYDVGAAKASFLWDSAGEANRFRPFYVLAVGHEEQLVRYLTELVAQRNRDDIKAIVFGRALAAPQVSWAAGTPVSSVGVVETSQLAGQAVRGTTGYLVRAPESGCKIVRRFPIRYSRFSPQLHTTRALPINGSILTGRTLQPIYGLGSYQSEFDSEKSTLTITVNLEPKAFPTGALILADVSPRPDANSFSLPAWVSQLSAASEEKDGSKTQHLADLIEDLWAASFNFPRVDFGTFQIYVSREQ